MTIIERAAKREAPVELDGKTYLFSRDAQGRYTAEVDDAKHAKRLLEIDGYTEIRNGKALPAREKVNTPEPEDEDDLLEQRKLTPDAPNKPTDPVVPPATPGAANTALDPNANGDTGEDLLRAQLAQEFEQLSGKKPNDAMKVPALTKAVENLRAKATKAGK